MGDSAEVQRQDKVGTFYILLYSLLIDTVWCLFWGGKWDQVPSLFHEMTLFFSWIGIIWKILIIICVCLLELDIIRASLLSSFKGKSNQQKLYYQQDDEQ